MGITVEIDRPGLVADLVERLAALGCLALVLDERRFRVAYPGAADEGEEWHELRFFLRAWQAGPGVQLRLRRESSAPVPGHTGSAYGDAARSTGFSTRP